MPIQVIIVHPSTTPINLSTMRDIAMSITRFYANHNVPARNRIGIKITTRRALSSELGTRDALLLVSAPAEKAVTTEDRLSLETAMNNHLNVVYPGRSIYIKVSVDTPVDEKVPRLRRRSLLARIALRDIRERMNRDFMDLRVNQDLVSHEKSEKISA